MHPPPQRRSVLTWVQPTEAERYEVYSEQGIAQAVLTINSPVLATIESHFGMYLINRKSPSSDMTVTDAGGSTVISIRTGWWNRRDLAFYDGRHLQFRASGLFRNRWIWRSDTGEPWAMVQRSQIFFSPAFPIREGFSAMLAGLSIYFLVTSSLKRLGL